MRRESIAHDQETLVCRRQCCVTAWQLTKIDYRSPRAWHPATSPAKIPVVVQLHVVFQSSPPAATMGRVRTKTVKKSAKVIIERSASALRRSSLPVWREVQQVSKTADAAQILPQAVPRLRGQQAHLR